MKFVFFLQFSLMYASLQNQKFPSQIPILGQYLKHYATVKPFVVFVIDLRIFTYEVKF